MENEKDRAIDCTQIDQKYECGLQENSFLPSSDRTETGAPSASCSYLPTRASENKPRFEVVDGAKPEKRKWIFKK